MQTKVGGHLEGGKRVGTAFAIASDYALGSFQIFATSPQRYWPTLLTDEDVAQAKAITESGVRIVVHAPYLLNLGENQEERNFKMTYLSLARHLAWANRIGAFGVVVHVGSAKGRKKEVALQNVVDCIKYVFSNEECPASGPLLLLENCAGSKAGTKLGVDLKELQSILDGLSPELRARCGVCWDTAHAWAAGVDILDSWHAVASSPDIRVVHLNNPDPGVLAGSFVDRHSVTMDEGQLQPNVMMALYVATRANKQVAAVIIEGSPNLDRDLHFIYAWELERLEKDDTARRARSLVGDVGGRAEEPVREDSGPGAKSAFGRICGSLDGREHAIYSGPGTLGAAQDWVGHEPSPEAIRSFSPYSGRDYSEKYVSGEERRAVGSEESEAGQD